MMRSAFGGKWVTGFVAGNRTRGSPSSRPRFFSDVAVGGLFVVPLFHVILFICVCECVWVCVSVCVRVWTFRPSTRVLFLFFFFHFFSYFAYVFCPSDSGRDQLIEDDAPCGGGGGSLSRWTTDISRWSRTELRWSPVESTQKKKNEQKKYKNKNKTPPRQMQTEETNDKEKQYAWGRLRSLFHFRLSVPSLHFLLTKKKQTVGNSFCWSWQNGFDGSVRFVPTFRDCVCVFLF